MILRKTCLVHAHFRSPTPSFPRRVFPCRLYGGAQSRDAAITPPATQNQRHNWDEEYGHIAHNRWFRTSLSSSYGRHLAKTVLSVGVFSYFVCSASRHFNAHEDSASSDQHFSRGRGGRRGGGNVGASLIRYVVSRAGSLADQLNARQKMDQPKSKSK